jgi:hypothetical protein
MAGSLMRNSGTFGPGDPRAGRPKGARTRLTAKVFEDLLTHWNEPAAPGATMHKGLEALTTLYREKPGEYLRLVASTLPREFVFDQVTSDLTDEDVDQLILKLRERLADQRRSPVPALAEPRIIDHEPRH